MGGVRVISAVPAIVAVRQRERWWRQVRDWMTERQVPLTDDPELLTQWGLQCWAEWACPTWEQEFFDQQCRRALVTLMLPGALVPGDRDLVMKIATTPMPPGRFEREILAPMVDGLTSGTCWLVHDPNTQADEFVVAQDPGTARDVGAAWLSAAPGAVMVTRVGMAVGNTRRRGGATRE